MPAKKTTPRTCEHCGQPFLARPDFVRAGFARFCSRGCGTAHRHPIPKKEIIGQRGAANPNWKGGISHDSHGYVLIRHLEHPRSHNGYVKRATLVLEKKLGRTLLPGEIAHHIDGDKQNDSPQNLELMLSGVHTKLHHPTREARPKIRKPDHPNNKRYVWPSDEMLLEMRKTQSLRQIAKSIGCNHKAVDGRLKRIRLRV